MAREDVGEGGRPTRIVARAAAAQANGRTAAMVMGAFLAGVLITALFVPRHTPSGVRSGGVTGQNTFGAGTDSQSVSGGNAGGGAAGTGTGGVGSAAGSELGAPGGGPNGTIAGAAASGTGGSGAGSPGPGTNGGATAKGVTATSITIGVIGGNSQDVTPACPRCGGISQATDQAMVTGLFRLWHKEGKLPIYGRDFTATYQDINDFDMTAGTSQCEALLAQNPFVTMTAVGASGAQSCLTEQHHALMVDAAGGVDTAQVLRSRPYFWELSPSIETIQVNYADWANQVGLLKGHVIGVYSPSDASQFAYSANEQEDLQATFFNQLHQLGYGVKVDYQYQNEGTSDDSVAVQKMATQGVTTVFIFGNLTEPSGFQNQAEQIGYHPKYPIADEGGFNFDDALADVEYNAGAEDGNMLFGNRWWNWSTRKPATPADNPAATECLTAYETQTGTTLDVYSNDSQVRYILDECADLQVIRQAIANAGPDLTQTSFAAGMFNIHGMDTAEFQSVTFHPDKLFGDDTWQSAQFSKSRWQPSNDYIKMLGPYTAFAKISTWTGS